MHYPLFIEAISQPRFARYYAACNNDTSKALELYRANIVLSQEIYGIIGIFEVTLRNCIDHHLKKVHGTDWLATAVSKNGFLTTSRGCEETVNSVQYAIQKLGAGYSHDELIAQLSFGFWKYFFSKREYAASGNSLIRIFVNRPFGTNQKLIYQNLVKIVKLRNRVAHVEPVCFLNKESKISTTVVRKLYQLILEMLRWLGFDPKELLHENDHVNEAIRAIENLKENRLKRFIDYILANPLRPYEGFPEYF
jgi:hypothetical protein